VLAPDIRPIQSCDLPRILQIQAACYPHELLEDSTTFQAKLHFAPQCNWMIEVDGSILGYLFCHPWQGDTPPALNRAEQPWPSNADRIYLHDLAIHPDGRGQKLSTLMAQHACDWAQQQGFSMAMLVAVGGAEVFWRELGFSDHPQQDASLSQYGQAVLMHKPL
jgi:GNAT superfamily N-acetyltransferase